MTEKINKVRKKTFFKTKNFKLMYLLKYDIFEHDLKDSFVVTKTFKYCSIIWQKMDLLSDQDFWDNLYLFIFLAHFLN